MIDGCRDLSERWELFLDGDLAAEDADAVADHLAVCAACRRWAEADRVLVAGLQGSGRELAGAGRPGRSFPRPRRVLAACLAAAALIAAAGLGWLFGPRPEAPRRPAAWPRAGEVLLEAAPGGSVTRALEGGGTLVLGAGGRLVAEAGAGAHAFRLEAGHVLLDRVAGPVVVRDAAAGVDVELRGSVFLAREDGGQDGAGALFVSVADGSVRALYRDDVPMELPAGTTWMLRDAGPLEVTAAVDRYEHLLEDEALVVMSGEQAFEVEARHQAEKRELERQVGELLAANARLQKPPDLRESIRSAVERRMRGGPMMDRRLYYALRDVQGHEDEALDVIAEELLAPGAPASSVRLALLLLGHVRHPRAVAMTVPFVDGAPEIREEAVRAVARQGQDAGRPILERVFREETDLDVKIEAAGGLQALGGDDASLAWLMDLVRKGGRSPATWRAFFCGIMKAPLARVAPFIVEMATGPFVSADEVLSLARWVERLESPAAVEIIDYLAAVQRDPAVAASLRALVDPARRP